MDDPRSLGLADLIPCDDLVRRRRDGSGRELIERTRIAQTDEVAALHRPDDLGVVPLRLCVDLRAEDQELRFGSPVGDHADLDIVEVRVDSEHHVGRQRPRGRRPGEERRVLFRELGTLTLGENGEAHVERVVRHLLVRAGHLVLREGGPAAGTPGHCTMALVEPALLVDQLQHVPDVRDVAVAVRVIGVVPVHPLAEPDGLLRDRGGAAVDAGAARARELVDPVGLDIALAVQVELALDLDLHP